MTILVILVFIIGYLAIVFETPLKINKAKTALLTGITCWIIYFVSSSTKGMIAVELLYHLIEIFSIVFFLLGVMAIVELIDGHDGFLVIINKISTRSKVKLLWIITVLTFFLSAVLDNLTTAIIMTSIVSKLLMHRNDRLWFTGMIIIAANAGGTFSPLGDVTTTMLWIGGQITAKNIVAELFFPSLIVCLVPLLIITPRFSNQSFTFYNTERKNVTNREASTVLYAGGLLLLLVPVLKITTDLPPCIGILFSLILMLGIVSIIHYRKKKEDNPKLSVSNTLQKIDRHTLLFFLGVLLGVAALQSANILEKFAVFLNHSLGNVYMIGSALGLVSAVVDNVPLVASVQGMYDLTVYPTDHHFWEFLALTTGTGGSIIIIGSAAGIAAMRVEKIEFMWYMKKISWLAIIGFVSGILVFIGQTMLFD